MQAEDVRKSRAGNRGSSDLCSRGDDQLVITDALTTVHDDFAARMRNGYDGSVGSDVDIALPLKVLRRVNDQVCSLLDSAFDVIRQAARAVGDCFAFFED